MTAPTSSSRGLAPVPGPHLLPATAHSYLERSATSLRDAITARDVPTRYACAPVAALDGLSVGWSTVLGVRTDVRCDPGSLSVEEAR